MALFKAGKDPGGLPNLVNKLTDQIDRVEKDVEIVRYRSASNEELLKEKIHRDHIAKRNEMLRQTTDLTEEQQTKLDDIKKALIGKESEKIA